MDQKDTRTQGKSENSENSYQDNEVRDIDNKNSPTRRDELVESIEILSGELNARLSQEMDSLMSMMQTQITRTFSSASNDRVIPENRIIIRNLQLDQNGTRTGTSVYDQVLGNNWKGPNAKHTKRTPCPPMILGKT